MHRLADCEYKERGSSDFPCVLYRVYDGHADFDMKFHWHSEVEIIFVREGTFTLMLNEEAETLHAGDVAYVPAMIVHGGTPDKGCKYDCVVFAPEFVTRSFFYQDLAPFFVVQSELRYFYPEENFPVLGDTVRRICELLEYPDGKANRLEIFGLLLQFFAVISRADIPSRRVSEVSSSVGRLSAAVQFIRENYARHVTLSEIAEACHVSPKYLCRIFNSLTGKTPIVFLNEYRIDRASELLRRTELPILDVAMKSGFDDQSYFTKLFRRQTSFTPRAYRIAFSDRRT